MWFDIKNRDFKGATQLVGAITLILIAIGGTTGVLLWAQRTAENYENQSEQQMGGEIKSSEASFAIYNVTSNNITIKNLGETKLKVDSFNVYLNNTKETITGTSKSGTINRSEKVILAVPTNLKSQTYKIEVTGQYNLMGKTISTSW